MTTISIHCSLSYHSLSDDLLDTFAIGSKNNMIKTENLNTFAARPVSDTDMGAFIKTHSDAYVAYKMGGINEQPAYTTARAALITALDSTADFINGLVKNNQSIANATIIAGGYVPTKANSTLVPVPAIPVNSTLDRGDIQQTGVINTITPPVAGATSYGCIVSEIAPIDPNSFVNGQLTIPAGNPNKIRVDVNKSRKKTFTTLASGVVHYFHFYAGNANGVSALSTPINIKVV